MSPAREWRLVLVAASCRSALRAHAYASEGARRNTHGCQQQVFADVREDMFVSAAYAVLENGSGKFTLARAGHDAPLLFRKSTGRKSKSSSRGGLALGIDKGPVFERVLKEMEIQMESGDVLLFYTDGINEAENPSRGRVRKGAAYWLDSQPWPSEGAEGVVENLPKEVKEFAGLHPQNDDITLVAVEKI